MTRQPSKSDLILLGLLSGGAAMTYHKKSKTNRPWEHTIGGPKAEPHHSDVAFRKRVEKRRAATKAKKLAKKKRGGK